MPSSPSMTRTGCFASSVVVAVAQDDQHGRRSNPRGRRAGARRPSPRRPNGRPRSRGRLVPRSGRSRRRRQRPRGRRRLLRGRRRAGERLPDLEERAEWTRRGEGVAAAPEHDRPPRHRLGEPPHQRGLADTSLPRRRRRARPRPRGCVQPRTQRFEQRVALEEPRRPWWPSLARPSPCRHGLCNRAPPQVVVRARGVTGLRASPGARPPPRPARAFALRACGGSTRRGGRLCAPRGRAVQRSRHCGARPRRDRGTSISRLVSCAGLSRVVARGPRGTSRAPRSRRRRATIAAAARAPTLWSSSWARRSASSSPASARAMAASYGQPRRRHASAAAAHSPASSSRSGAGTSSGTTSTSPARRRHRPSAPIIAFAFNCTACAKAGYRASRESRPAYPRARPLRPALPRLEQFG